MTTNPIDAVFKQLRADGRKALIPFITAGDPDLATTAALVKELTARCLAHRDRLSLQRPHRRRQRHPGILYTGAWQRACASMTFSRPFKK